MKGCEVASFDQAVVDSEGSIWVFDHRADEWRYITDEGLSWDSHYELPERYEPYVKLDDAAARVVLRRFPAAQAA